MNILFVNWDFVNPKILNLHFFLKQLLLHSLFVILIEPFLLKRRWNIYFLNPAVIFCFHALNSDFLKRICFWKWYKGVVLFNPSHFLTVSSPYSRLTTMTPRTCQIHQYINDKISNSLKYKLPSETFGDASLKWHLSLPRLSITRYHDLIKKLVHQFATSRHENVSTTNLFNILHSPPKSLKKVFRPL